MSTRYHENLTKILDEERALILGGGFDRLADVVKKKEAALQDFATLGAQQRDAAIPGLQAKLRENARLLEAAMLGFEHAKMRLNDIRGTIGQLKTYNGQGKVSSSRTAGPSMSFKA
jgi:flagellar biosynthesis/type III secretory pathway chaperone